MTNPQETQNDLHVLVSAMLDGTLDDAGRQQLSELLQTDADARRFYFSYIRMQTLLEASHAPLLPVLVQCSGQDSGVSEQPA